jgi:hypothetical protein
MSEKFSIKKMPKPQRYGFYFLSFLAIGIIFLWIWQFNYRLSSPFMPENRDQAPTANENLFTDFQEFDSFMTDDDQSFIPISDEGDSLLYNPDEIPEETVNIPIQEPLIGDEFEIDRGDYEDILMDALGGEANPESLRELLLASGLEEAMVYELSDEELMSVYKEVLLGQ